MIVDIIFIANTANGYIKSFTQKAIDSLRASETNYNFNIILVETNADAEAYSDVNVWIKPKCEFNYNKFLNLAYEYAVNDYLVVSNNDVEFHKNWFTNIKEAMDLNNLDTASPKSPTYQTGLRNSAEYAHRNTPDSQVVQGFITVVTFCGWCWVANKKAKEYLFPLDEQFSFYFQDDDICLTLQKGGFNHGLVAKSHVSHMGQSSHKLLPKDQYMNFTWNLHSVLKNKWNI